MENLSPDRGYLDRFLHNLPRQSSLLVALSRLSQFPLGVPVENARLVSALLRFGYRGFAVFHKSTDPTVTTNLSNLIKGIWGF